MPQLGVLCLIFCVCEHRLGYAAVTTDPEIPVVIRVHFPRLLSAHCSLVQLSAPLPEIRAEGERRRRITSWILKLLLRTRTLTSTNISSASKVTWPSVPSGGVGECDSFPGKDSACLGTTIHSGGALRICLRWALILYFPNSNQSTRPSELFFPPTLCFLSCKSQCVAGGQGDGLCHPSYPWCLDTRYMFSVRISHFNKAPPRRQHWEPEKPEKPRTVSSKDLWVSSVIILSPSVSVPASDVGTIFTPHLYLQIPERLGRHSHATITVN